MLGNPQDQFPAMPHYLAGNEDQLPPECGYRLLRPAATQHNPFHRHHQVVRQDADLEVHGVRSDAPTRHVVHPEAALEFLVVVLGSAPLIVKPDHFLGRPLVVVGRNAVIAVGITIKQVLLPVPPTQHHQRERLPGLLQTMHRRRILTVGEPAVRIVVGAPGLLRYCRDYLLHRTVLVSSDGEDNLALLTGVDYPGLVAGRVAPEIPQPFAQ